MAKAYVFLFHESNHVRNTEKAYGFAFHEDKSKVTWFAKSRAQIQFDFFGEGEHGIVVHPWLTKQIFQTQSELFQVMLDLGQVIKTESDIDWKDLRDMFKERKIEGTVWKAPY